MHRVPCRVVVVDPRIRVSRVRLPVADRVGLGLGDQQLPLPGGEAARRRRLPVLQRPVVLRRHQMRVRALQQLPMRRVLPSRFDEQRRRRLHVRPRLLQPVRRPNALRRLRRRVDVVGDRATGLHLSRRQRRDVVGRHQHVRLHGPEQGLRLLERDVLA